MTGLSLLWQRFRYTQVFIGDLVEFETGAFRLYVEKGDRPGPVFDFIVPDMEAAKIRLLAAGCTIIEEDPSIPRCYIRDPLGLVFNIEQVDD